MNSHTHTLTRTRHSHIAFYIVSFVGLFCKRDLWFYRSCAQDIHTSPSTHEHFIPAHYFHRGTSPYTRVSFDTHTRLFWHVHTCLFWHVQVKVMRGNAMREESWIQCGWYRVASVSRIDKIIGLFCRILSLLWGSFAKETYNLIDPTNQSHPIRMFAFKHVRVWKHAARMHARYGVDTVSTIDKIIGLFCRILSLLQGSFANVTYILIDPTKQSHSIPLLHVYT